MEKNKVVEYQTWLVCVNIDNVNANYQHVLNSGEALLQMSDYDFKVTLKNEFFYHDEIDWKNVDLKAVREHLAESI